MGSCFPLLTTNEIKCLCLRISPVASRASFAGWERNKRLLCSLESCFLLKSLSSGLSRCPFITCNTNLHSPHGISISERKYSSFFLFVPLNICTMTSFGYNYQNSFRRSLCNVVLCLVPVSHKNVGWTLVCRKALWSSQFHQESVCLKWKRYPG